MRGEVVGYPAAAVCLDRSVDHLQADVGDGELDAGDFDAGVLVADRVHEPGGLHHEQARHLQLDPRLGDPVADVPVVGDGVAEGLAVIGTLAHELERSLARADRTHAVVDPPRTESRLGDQEPHPLAGQDVARRNAHVLERQDAVALRLGVAEDRRAALDGHAWRVERAEDHRLLLVGRGRRIGLTHDHEDPAVGVQRPGRPPLAPVEHVLVAVALDTHPDVGRVRRGDIRLGHRKPGADLAVEQRPQPTVLLLLAAEVMQDLHVARVRRVAVARLRGDLGSAHDLRKRRVLEIGQPGAVLGVGKEQVPQPAPSRLSLQLLHHGRMGVRRPGRGQFLGIHLLGWIHVSVHEGHQPLLKVHGALRRLEVHWMLLRMFS